MSSIPAALLAKTVNFMPLGNWLSALDFTTVMFPWSACITEASENANMANKVIEVMKTNVRNCVSRANFTLALTGCRLYRTDLKRAITLLLVVRLP
jgi:hypothetical protein